MPPSDFVGRPSACPEARREVARLVPCREAKGKLYVGAEFFELLPTEELADSE